MSKISLEKVCFSYKDSDDLFSKISVTFDTSWKLGVIGRNGRGKTTLLKLINGELIPESGYIKKDVKTVYFPYEYFGEYNNTLDVIKECVGNISTLEKNIDDPEILEKYIELDGFSIEGKIKKELKKINLNEDVLNRDFTTLSSGERAKALLIALFLNSDTFVLLDEPTNHLDVIGKREVMNYLSKKHGFIIVSHQAEFLDIVIDHVMSINKSNFTIAKGNYTTWKENFELIQIYESRTKLNLIKEIEKLEKHSEKKREWASTSNTQRYHFASNSRTNGVQAYMGQAKRAEKKIQDDILEKRKLLKNFEQKKDLIINQDDIEVDYLVKVDHLSFSYSEKKLLLNDISFDLKKNDILWIRGANGSGKSTLLRLIIEKKYPENIKYCKNISFAVLNQEIFFPPDCIARDFLGFNKTEDEMAECIQVCQMLDISKNLLSKQCNNLSEGERKKICLANILCKSNNVIILDEPLNYMDVIFQEQLEKAIKISKPTMIFVEHDSNFANNIATKQISL